MIESPTTVLEAWPGAPAASVAIAGAALAVLGPAAAGGAVMVVRGGPVLGRAASVAGVLCALTGAVGVKLATIAAVSGSADPNVEARLVVAGMDGWSAWFALAVAGLIAVSACVRGGALAGGRAARGPAAALWLLATSAWMAMALAPDLAWLAAAIAALGIVAPTALALAETDTAGGGVSLRALNAMGLAGALAWLGAALALGTNAVLVGGALAAAGCAAAGGLAPLHGWLAGAASRAHSPAVALFLGAGAVSAFAGLGRAAAAAGATTQPGVGVALIALGAAAMAIGSIQALAARDARRLAVYALSAQLGGAALTLAMASPEGAAAAAMRAAAAGLGAAMVAIAAAGDGRFSALHGLARIAPARAACGALGCMILMGAPLTLGFPGLWLALEALIARGWLVGAGALAASSLAAIVFCGGLIARMLFRAPSPEAEFARDGPVRGWAAGLAAFVAAALGLAGPWIALGAEAAGLALMTPVVAVETIAPASSEAPP